MKHFTCILALFAILGTSNLYAVGAPVDHSPNKGSGGCPPVCGIHGWQDQYNAAMIAHVSVGNTAYYGKLPTEAQFTAAGNAMIAAANALKDNGQLAGAQQAILEALQQNPNLFQGSYDSTVAYNNAKPFGNLMTVADMNGYLQSISSSERQQMAGLIKQYGLYTLLVDMANQMIQFGKEYGGVRHSNPKLRNASVGHASFLRVDAGSAYIGTVAMVGAVFCIMPGLELLGGMMLVGAAAGAWAESLDE